MLAIILLFCNVILVYAGVAIIYWLVSKLFQPRFRKIMFFIGAFIGLSFGTTARTNILKGNKAVAIILKDIAQKLNSNHSGRSLRAILQIEIKEALESSFSNLVETLSNIVPINPIKSRKANGKYVGVLDVLVAAKNIINTNNITNRVVVCVHPAMWIRTSILSWILGFKYRMMVTEEIYDPKSDQIWTKIPFVMWVAEPAKCLVNIPQALMHRLKCWLKHR